MAIGTALNYAERIALATSIAEALGLAVQTPESEHERYVRLNGRDGVGLYLEFSERYSGRSRMVVETRLVVSGSWPKWEGRVLLPRDVYLDGVRLSHVESITLAAHKPVPAIVADISRRYWTPYLGAHKQIRLDIVRREAENASRGKVMGSIVARTSKTRLSGEALYHQQAGNLSVGSDGAVRFSSVFYTSAAKAIKILKLLESE